MEIGYALTRYLYRPLLVPAAAVLAAGRDAREPEPGHRRQRSPLLRRRPRFRPTGLGPRCSPGVLGSLTNRVDGDLARATGRVSPHQAQAVGTDCVVVIGGRNTRMIILVVASLFGQPLVGAAVVGLVTAVQRMSWTNRHLDARG